jgi:hypothetical protein
MVVAGKLDTVMAVDIEDGRIKRLFVIRNPDKLASAAPGN